MNKPGIAVVVWLVLLGSLSPARAQFFPQSAVTSPPENIEGFTVVGKAYTAAKPNLVEIDLDVSASSELTADAIVKYRDAKKRIHEAFAALNLKCVAIE